MHRIGGERVREIVLKGVGRQFGSTVALRSVSARFTPGTVHIVCGANGSGKSTLLQILAGVLPASWGEVHYSPSVSARDARALTGWLGHEALVYPDLSARENIELAARFHGSRLDENGWERVRSRFRFGSFADRPCRTYSRGQLQRLALARCLIHCPSLVLLDEPTTGLDISGLEMLKSVLGEELNRGAIVVVITHDPSFLRDINARVIQLTQGRYSEGVE